jgi:hypothetical protein
MSQNDTGKRVSGPSGQSFGTVQRVLPGAFLLTTNYGEEYWLSRDCVYDVDDGHVILICEREGLGRYLTDPPVEERTP